MNVTNRKEKRENMAFVAKINYYRKSFGQKYIDYLGPKYFYLMLLYI